MRSNVFRESSVDLMIALLLLCFVLAACGTRDYGPEEAGEQSDARPVDTRATDTRAEGAPAADNGQRDRAAHYPHYRVPPLLFSDGLSSGYLWDGLEWVGVPDDMLSSFKDSLMDDVGTHPLAALGTTVVGGTILGIVTRMSGSWFFGGPIDSKAGHWFWRGVDRARKATGQGFVRGGLVGGLGCHLLLTGFGPLSYNGLLGPEFSALSSSLILGGMASVTLMESKLLDKYTRRNWSDPNLRLNKLLSKFKFSKGATHRFEYWSKTTSFGKGVRYKLLPGISIVGVGAATGLIVYHSLQEEEPDWSEYYEEP